MTCSEQPRYRRSPCSAADGRRVPNSRPRALSQQHRDVVSLIAWALRRRRNNQERWRKSSPSLRLLSNCAGPFRSSQSAPTVVHQMKARDGRSLSSRTGHSSLHWHDPNVGTGLGLADNGQRCHNRLSDTRSGDDPAGDTHQHAGETTSSTLRNHAYCARVSGNSDRRWNSFMQMWPLAGTTASDRDNDRKGRRVRRSTA